MTNNNTYAVPSQSATLTRESWFRSFMDHVSYHDNSRIKNDGTNFTDWEAALKNAAVVDGKLKYLIEPIPAEPSSRTKALRNSYDEFVREAGAIKNVLIYAMEPHLQRRFISQNANRIFTTLTNEFSQAMRIVRYDATVRFFEAKMQKGQAVSPHVLNMIENVEKLDSLGYKIKQSIVVGRILHSLHDGFTQFRVNYNMNDMQKSLHELHSQLVQAEKDLNLSGSSKIDVLVIHSKGKRKANASLNVKRAQFKKKAHSKPRSGLGESSSSRSKGANFECHLCHKTGHWRRNCPKYIEDIKAGRVTAHSMSSYIHMIEINHASSSTWVFDIGCGSHLCNHLQGLRDVRRLEREDIDLRVGNGAKVAVVSVGTYVLSLPSSFELVLKNCFYVPSLSKNIISVNMLNISGFSFIIKANCCTFSLNDRVYGTAVSKNGIYVLDQTTDIYHVNDNNKMAKTGDKDQTYLWHCRMGHINEKRVKKLIKNGTIVGI
ncbi:hypothetical protein vseg_017762 [Gypsophila vaccaria]